MNESGSQRNPPDILLTNFMMAELLLTRQDSIDSQVIANANGLEFIVLDELHTYRGRQGADVAILVRRLRDRCTPGKDPICIGTSATMINEGDDASRGPGGLGSGLPSVRNPARSRRGDRRVAAPGHGRSPDTRGRCPEACECAGEKPSRSVDRYRFVHPSACGLGGARARPGGRSSSETSPTDTIRRRRHIACSSQRSGPRAL